MITLLRVILYSFRYIYWALIEFFSSFGKSQQVQGIVESATSQPGPLGLHQVCVRYRYTANGRTYADSFIRECSRQSNQILLQRFPVGGAVWLKVDESHPRRSYLPSGLGYAGPLIAVVPVTVLAILWLTWLQHVLVSGTHSSRADSHNVAITCPAGLPGTPESAADSTDQTARRDLISYKSKPGEFSILLPRHPRPLVEESLPTAYGQMELFRSSAETPDAWYEASYGDVPGNGPINIALWLTASGNARLQKSVLIDRHEIKLNGIPGNAYTAADDQYYWSERIYFVDRRFYRITIYVPRSTCNWPPHAATILNSFRTTHAATIWR